MAVAVAGSLSTPAASAITFSSGSDVSGSRRPMRGPLRLPLVAHLSQLRFLFRSQDVHELLTHGELLRHQLGPQGRHLGELLTRQRFVKCAARFGVAQRFLLCAELLAQTGNSRLMIFTDLFHLCLLRVGQIELRKCHVPASPALMAETV